MRAFKPTPTAHHTYAAVVSKEKSEDGKRNPTPIRVLSPDIDIAFSDLKLRHAKHTEEDVGGERIDEAASDYESLSRSESASGSDLSDADDYSSGASSAQRREPKGHQNFKSNTKPSRPFVDTSATYGDRKGKSPLSPNSRAWYEFDLAVVVALVSPIGNWLTGTDHVKNILLVVLLVFYLHQIIEVPWTLYQNARARRMPSKATDADATQALAASELHRLELFFLTLTFLSPLAGAALLRSATAALLGPNAVSSFSTALFVLATGLRPWAHLVERLSGRVEALQEAVHHSPSTEREHEREKRMKALEDRIHELERAMNRARGRADSMERFVGGAMDNFERVLHAQEHHMRRVTADMRGVEASMEELSNSRVASPAPVILRAGEHRGMLTFAWRTLVAELQGAFRRLPYPIQHNVRLEGKDRPVPSRIPSGSPRLDTIMEETSDDPKTTVSSTPHPLGWIWVYLVAAPYALVCSIALHMAYAATLPVRAVERMVISREY